MSSIQFTIHNRNIDTIEPFSYYSNTIIDPNYNSNTIIDPNYNLNNENEIQYYSNTIIDPNYSIRIINISNLLGEEYFNRLDEEYEYQTALEESNHDQELVRNENQILNMSSVKFKNVKTNDNTCTICCTQFENDDSVILLNCNHIFHKECINEWIHYKAECPLCKTSVNVTQKEN